MNQIDVVVFYLKKQKIFKNGIVLNEGTLLIRNAEKKSDRFLYNTFEGDSIFWFYADDSEVELYESKGLLLNDKNLDDLKKMRNSWV
jgi:hypothetical protein